MRRSEIILKERRLEHEMERARAGEFPKMRVPAL